MPISAAMPAEARESEAGFTLVEMLVAMLLLSMVGLALARFQTGQLRGSASASLTTAARLVADNLAVDLMVEKRAPVAPLAGKAAILGQHLAWTVTPRGGAALPVDDFVTFDVAVHRAEGGAPLASRQLLRPMQWPGDETTIGEDNTP